MLFLKYTWTVSVTPWVGWPSVRKKIMDCTPSRTPLRNQTKYLKRKDRKVKMNSVENLKKDHKFFIIFTTKIIHNFHYFHILVTKIENCPNNVFNKRRNAQSALFYILLFAAKYLKFFSSIFGGEMGQLKVNKRNALTTIYL